MASTKYTKNSILKALKTGENYLSHTEATSLLNEFFKSIILEVKKERTVKFFGFGSFREVIRASRKVKDFKTGEMITIKSFKEITFKKSITTFK